MKPNTLIRSDKAHAVNMPAGSNVAARQNTQKFKPSEPTDDSLTNTQKVMPVKTPKIKRIEPPAAPVKTVRSKAAISPPPQAPSKPVKPKTASGKTARPQPKLRTTQPSGSAKAQAQPAAPTPTEPVWEQDNPVKTRIDQLRARNAQLAEQLQRLPQMPIARGKRP
jgi:hypothetical protein